MSMPKRQTCIQENYIAIADIVKDSYNPASSHLRLYESYQRKFGPYDDALFPVVKNVQSR